MKAGRDHRVPLGPRALQIVGELAAEARKRSPDIRAMPVFHGAHRTRPLSNMSLTAVLRRMRLDVVPHGFRATFKTWRASGRASSAKRPRPPWHMWSVTRSRPRTSVAI